MDKEVVLLVGPQGSGKTTYCQKFLSSYFRVSQDDMGKKEHYQQYLQALDYQNKIVVDRLNHLSSFRKRYLDLAKQKGFRTKIIVLHESFSTCYFRILSRKDHPTLGASTHKKTILKALRMYFKEYERPSINEADEVVFLSDQDPYVLDLSKKYSKFLIIGDVHGCYNEMMELISQAQFVDDGSMAIVFLGDLVDKGPNVKEVINFILHTKHAYSVRGNHDDKFLRYLRGNTVLINNGLDKTLAQLNLESTDDSFKESLLFFFEDLPYVIKLKENMFCIHAGLHPLTSIYSQKKEHLLYVRTFNLETGTFSNEHDPFWFEHYPESFPTIFFGHQFHDSIAVRSNVYALDGYCVYGKEMRGVIIENGVVSKHIVVPAKENYYEESKCSPQKKRLLEMFEEVKKGYVKVDEYGSLMILNYTNKTVYEKHWNEYTCAARGLIVEKDTFRVIARPFKKFFNLGETPQTQLQNLPLHLEYDVYEKFDGCLGIIYYYDGAWRISTRGKIVSEQSKIGEELLQHYDVSKFKIGYTYLVEIIDKRISPVISYPESKLILLGAIENNKGFEVTYRELKQISLETGIPSITRLPLTIEQAIEQAESMGLESEGFVVRFENDVRVKIKGKMYLNATRIALNLNSLSLWKAMKDGKIPKEVLYSIPEEYLEELEPKIIALEQAYQNVRQEIEKELDVVLHSLSLSSPSLKDIALYLQNKGNDFKHSCILLSFFKQDFKAIDEYIMKSIRPKENS